MNCIITLKINDYNPKIPSIPYENFICIFTNDDFIGKIPLSKKLEIQCVHEIPKINNDIKYTLHVLESNSSSLIGISELLIPLIKLKQVNPPCTIIQEQKLKILIDTNTKRKLFKTLINSSDIFLFIRAEIFIPNINNIGNLDLSKIEVKRKNINSNNDKKNLNSTKRKRITKEIRTNKEVIKNDLNLLSNNNKTISYDNKNNNNSSKIKLMNDIKNSFKKIDEINLSSKGIKKLKLSQKRSPKKRVTILELMEQKMKMNPLLLNMSEEKNLNESSDKKINIKLNKNGKKLTSPKSKKENKKELIKTIEKHSSKKFMSSKNSNEVTSSTKRIKNASAICSNKQINLPNDDINTDINRNLYDNNFNKNKVSYDLIQINKFNDHSYIENEDINSNYGILSTEERTEQVLSEIDKIILEKSTKLRDVLENQIKNSSNYKKNSGTLYMKDKGNINKSIEMNDNMMSINKSSIGNDYNNNSMNFISQENLKNNYLSLIDLYYLLSQKLSKIILENSFSFNKLNLIKEEFKSENKKGHLINRQKDNLEFNSSCNDHINKYKIVQQLINTKNLESKLYQTIFSFHLNDFEIIRQKEIERVNKLNEGRKLNILLKLIRGVIFDIGNISQVFKNDKYKQNILKNILAINNIKEKEEGARDYINLWGLGLINKYKLFDNDNFENKIIREVDEDKEEESEFNSSIKKKTKNKISKLVLDELLINPNIHNETKPDDDENKIENVDNSDEIDENNKKIEVMKDILINKFKGNKKFSHIKNDEFLFDNKFQIKASLSENNEIFIEFENNKYNMDSFLLKYCKEENIGTQNDFDKKEKGTFIYSKKIMPQNEHQKRRRKKRIIDDSEE